MEIDEKRDGSESQSWATMGDYYVSLEEHIGGKDQRGTWPVMFGLGPPCSIWMLPRIFRHRLPHSVHNLFAGTCRGISPLSAKKDFGCGGRQLGRGKGFVLI